MDAEKTEFTTQEAAAAVGKSKSTIWRACKAGKLAYTLGDDDEFIIQGVDLFTKYSKTAAKPLKNKGKAQSDETFQETLQLKAELRLTREMLDREREHFRTYKEDSSDNIRALHTQIEKLHETHNATLRLLETRRDEIEPETPKKRGILGIFG